MIAGIALGAALITGASPAIAAPALSDDPVAIAAANHATRSVLIDTRLSESPTPSDFEIATRLFAIVAELAPADADLARLQTASAFGTGNPRLLEQATARVVAIDPADTVSQLRLITARIGQKQTVDERIKIYERLMGPRGVSIDATVRSRLALDAALIFRETGDLDSFLRMLTLATDLDRTNKEAHHLATSYYSEFAGMDPAGIAGLLEMQIRLLYSDPIDPNVHFGISRLLAVEGATVEASRFYRNGISILTRAGLLEPRHRVESLALQWLIDGPQIVLKQIDRELRLARDNARIVYERDSQRDVPDRFLTPPEEVFLDPLYEKIRIIAAMDAQDAEALKIGLNEIDAYMRYQYRQVEEATKLDDAKTQAEAYRNFASSLVSLQFMRALAGVDLQALAAEIPQVARQIGQEEWNRLRKPLEAWVALRIGQPEKTREILNEIGTPNSIMRVCAAELYAYEGNDRAAAAEFERILRVDPFIPYGAWARSRAMELTGRTDPVTEAGRIMRRLVAEVPESLDVLTTDPSAVMSLSISSTKAAFGPDDRSKLKITLTNTTPWPLSLGPNRTISSRILLGVSTDDIDSFVSNPQPVVVDLDRRFRLAPGEELTIEVPVERGYNGLVFDSSTLGVIRQRWQGWQSPAVDHTGGYAAGPYSLSDSTRKFQRSTRNSSRLPAADITAMIQNAKDKTKIVEAIESAAAHTWREESCETVLVDALVARYESAGPVERLLMVAALPTAGQIPEMEPFDAAVRKSMGHEAIRQVETPRTLAAMTLLTRVRDPGDPLLKSASESDDKTLARVAMLLRDRLTQGRSAYATRGPGAASLAGATKVNAIQGEPAP